MAGDENKRSEAGTEPEAETSTSGASAPKIDPPIAGSEALGESPPPQIHAATPSGSEEEGPAVAERTAGGAAASVGPGARAKEEAPSLAPPRARAPLLPRLIPYLVVFALGALVSIGAAFILNLLAHAPEQRGDIDERLAALDRRAAALERREETDRTTLGGLADRFGAAEGNARQAITVAREVEKTLAARPPSNAPLEGGTATEPPDLAPLTARIAALEQKLEEQNASAGTGGGGAEASGASAEVARAQGAAIVAGRLVQEVERGAPFLRELNALLALGVDESKLAPLRGFAETGVASVGRLADDFARAAPAVLAAEHKTGKHSLVDRLKGYASNLVQIERMDDLERRDVHGLVARIKFALAHDHVADAYALWSELPDAAKASSESFGMAAKNRLDALDAARSIEAGAVAAISKPKS